MSTYTETTYTLPSPGDCCCGGGPCCLLPDDPDFPNVLHGQITTPGCAVYDGLTFDLTWNPSTSLWESGTIPLTVGGTNCSLNVTVQCTESGEATGLSLIDLVVGDGAGVLFPSEYIRSCGPLFLQADGAAGGGIGCCETDGLAFTLTVAEP